MTPIEARQKDLTDRAMLVRLSIRWWKGHSKDRKDAGWFNKALIAKEALKEVQQADTAAREFHYNATMPWTDDGYRLLPVTMFYNYCMNIQQYRQRFETAVDRFATNFDGVVEEARLRLNGLFDPADYPVNISSRFSFSPEIAAIPSRDDFRVTLRSSETAEIQNQITDRVQQSLLTAHRDLYRRLLRAVARMAEQLGGEGSRWHHTLVDNLRDLVELLPALNIQEDRQLEHLRRQVEEKLCRFDSDTLKTNDTARQQTAENATEILKILEGMYGSK